MAAVVELEYLRGFGNEHLTEALPNALPKINTPQKCPYGLYAEQLSGTAFTAPRVVNQRSWLYRIRPPTTQKEFVAVDHPTFCKPYVKTNPTAARWAPNPFPDAATSVDFVDGLVTFCGAGDPGAKAGMAVHYYSANKDMSNKAFYNSDGDFLIVPQSGTLVIQTELGLLNVPPNSICVIPRGIRFAVRLPDGPSRGYICEVYDSHFRIPDLGPIGANGCANPRDFYYPVAAYEDIDGDYTIVTKHLGSVWEAKLDHSPFDVVAWFGNYAPWKYNLADFVVVNSVSWEHLDPSIFTVVTAPSAVAGTAVCDFAIFPPRWSVQMDTFRPPYYHRNCMSEFMGLITGVYEAKLEGFQPGGASLHLCMTPHGPDAQAFEGASNANLVPTRVADNTMAFMFETCYLTSLTEWAASSPLLDTKYLSCWAPLKNNFRNHPDKLALSQQ